MIFEEKTNRKGAKGAQRKEESAFGVSFLVKNSLGFLTVFQL
jgi:hypothetical protein